MKQQVFLLLILTTFMISCLKEKKIIIKHDFENSADGWNQNNLVMSGAHSGKYFTQTDSTHEFSAGFAKSLSDITPLKIKRIDLVAWIRKADYNSSADLILSLEKGTTMVFYKLMSTKMAFPEYNEWTRMFASYDLPDSIGKNLFMKVYFLNKNKFPVDADDFEIRLFTE